MCVCACLKIIIPSAHKPNQLIPRPVVPLLFFMILCCQFRDKRGVIENKKHLYIPTYAHINVRQLDTRNYTRIRVAEGAVWVKKRYV